MGRYINWTDVVNRYPDAARVAGAEQLSSSWLYHAEYEVEARLAAVYVVPFTNTPAPAVVQDLCIDLTYYKATLRQKGSEKIYEYLKDRFEQLINGTIKIPDTTGVATAGSAAFMMPTHQTAFGFDDSINWQPPEDEVVASEDRR